MHRAKKVVHISRLLGVVAYIGNASCPNGLSKSIIFFLALPLHKTTKRVSTGGVGARILDFVCSFFPFKTGQTFLFARPFQKRYVEAKDSFVNLEPLPMYGKESQRLEPPKALKKFVFNSDF